MQQDRYLRAILIFIRCAAPLPKILNSVQQIVELLALWRRNRKTVCSLQFSIELAIDFERYLLAIHIQSVGLETRRCSLLLSAFRLQ